MRGRLSVHARMAMKHPCDIRGLGGAMGVSLVASSDVRGLGGAMGVVLAASGGMESDVRG